MPSSSPELKKNIRFHGKNKKKLIYIPSSSPEDVKSCFRFLFIGVAVSNSLGGLIKVLRAVLEVRFMPGVKNLLRESTRPLGLFSKLLDGSNLIIVNKYIM